MSNSKIEQAVEKKNFKKLSKFAEGKDAELRIEAIEGMGKVEGEDSFNYLTGSLRNPDAKIRAAAATGLSSLRDTKARAFLEHQLKNEQDTGVQSKIREALSSIRSV